MPIKIIEIDTSGPISIAEVEIQQTGPRGFPGLDGADGDGTAYYGQLSRTTSGTVSGLTTGVYKTTGLAGTLDAEAYGFERGTDQLSLKNTSGETNLVRVYASADVQAGNNKVLGLKLALDGVLLDETECRAPTGVGTTFAKLVTSWIVEIPNGSEIALYLANHSDSSNLTVQRCRIIVATVGRQGEQGPNIVTSATTSDGSASLSVASLTTAATVYGNGATFSYGTGSASNHRTALGLGSFATLENNGTANLSVALLSASSAQVGGNFSVSGDITANSLTLVTSTLSFVNNSNPTLSIRAGTSELIRGFSSAFGNQPLRVLASGGLSLGGTNAPQLRNLGDGVMGLGIYGDSNTSAGSLSLTNLTASKIDAVAVGASNIVTEADNFTVSEATHAGRYIRLTKSSAEQQITWPATGIATGREFFFFRATDRAITFAGSGVVTGASRLADVVENSGFGVKCTGVGTYDMI